MSFCIFEDQKVEDLHPITLAKPAYAITCGSYRLYDWIAMIGNPAVGFVRPHLQDIQIHDFSHLVSKSLPSDEPLVLVNARTTPRLENIRVLRQLQKEGQPGVVMSNGRVAAVVITDASQHPTVENTDNGFATYLTEIG
ncbi:MAG: putative sugar nucleotidyl transferase, partial [bacterium]|nr:putative sugar nucleotidyl transferase [bacterium]